MDDRWTTRWVDRHTLPIKSTTNLKLLQVLNFYLVTVHWNKKEAIAKLKNIINPSVNNSMSGQINNLINSYKKRRWGDSY